MTNGQLFENVRRWAHFSACRRYRYDLGRQWGSGPRMVVVGLNPSTADEEHDDPTVRRCVSFAKREKCGSLEVVNLFAWRSTDPAAMMSVKYPVGPDNDYMLRTIAREVSTSEDTLVLAWGAHGSSHGRDKDVLKILERQGCSLWCLGANRDGSPKHPLYLKADTPLEPFTR